MPSPKDTAQKELTRRRRIFFGLILGWMPLGALTVFVFRALGIDPDGGPLLPALAATYLVGLAYASWRYQSFCCPQCDERFFLKSLHGIPFWGNIFARKCVNCGFFWK